MIQLAREEDQGILFDSDQFVIAKLNLLECYRRSP